jgi:hypothetical protein
MGKEILGNGYTEEDVKKFKKNLEAETQILRDWFKNDSFAKDMNKTGIELEAWLVDENMLPDPYSTEFLEKLSDEQVVPEIARFNFEINSTPYKLEGKVFSALEKELNKIWGNCEKVAKEEGKHAMLVGTLPSLRPAMLSMEYLRSYE